jgi:hypothetical protein
MIVGVGLAATAAAGPIDVDRLSLKRSGDRERLSFVSHDESWIMPATAAPDDGPGPISIELFSTADPSGQTLGIPQLDAPTAWRVSLGADGSIVRFRLRNDAAPNAAGDFSGALLRKGRVLRFVGRRTGLALDGAQGQVGIRITMAGQVLCALFRDGTVGADQPGRFLGKHALASDIADCRTETLGGVTPCGVVPGAFECGGTCPAGESCVVDDPFAPSCHCIGPTSPCGETAPLCNGMCPDGSACTVTTAGTFTTCGCVPPGGCQGLSGYPTCGGTCPAGQECHPYFAQVGQFLRYSGCACASPGPCDCTGTLACPAGQICTFAQVPGICIPQCQ